MPDNLDKRPADEINRIAAVEVMGWKAVEVMGWMLPKAYWADKTGEHAGFYDTRPSCDYFDPANRLDHAFILLKKLRRRWWYYLRDCGGQDTPIGGRRYVEGYLQRRKGGTQYTACYGVADINNPALATTLAAIRAAREEQT